MKLLVITQSVDTEDSALGFFHQWLLEFSNHVEKLTVICLREGKHALPKNVEIYSLGKEKGTASRITYSLRFLLLSWKLRKEYDSVFVHMNPEYAILSGLLWKALGKKVGLWYMHKSVTWRLRIGILFSDIVFTASSRSMRVNTSKKIVMGHGIYLEAKKDISCHAAYPPLKLLTIGRISRVKRIDIIIDAIDLLRKKAIPVEFNIVGGPVTVDGVSYMRELENKVSTALLQDSVRFEGPIGHSDIESFFPETHLFLHASDTGSLDKASLEPLCYGVPLITTDTELGNLGLGGVIRVRATAEDFAGAIEEAMKEHIWENGEMRKELQEYVQNNHNLSSLVPRIVANLMQ